MSDPRSVFVAGPFKAVVDPATGELDPLHKRRLLRLIDFFERRGLAVYNAHRREGWGKAFLAPEECTRLDFEEIGAADLFVALPGSPASPGTHVEIGWASALRKPIVLLLEREREYAFLVRGLPAISDARLVEFSDDDELFDGLEDALDAIAGRSRAAARPSARRPPGTRGSPPAAPPARRSS